MKKALITLGRHPGAAPGRRMVGALRAGAWRPAVFHHASAHLAGLKNTANLHDVEVWGIFQP